MALVVVAVHVAALIIVVVVSRLWSSWLHPLWPCSSRRHSSRLVVVAYVATLVVVIVHVAAGVVVAIPIAAVLALVAATLVEGMLAAEMLVVVRGILLTVASLARHPCA